MNGYAIAMRRCPTEFDITLALADALRGADLPYAHGFVEVSRLLDVLEPRFRLSPTRHVSVPLSQLLSGLLQRRLHAEDSEWVIDATEARTLIRTFHR
jgi:hypothetical protein